MNLNGIGKENIVKKALSLPFSSQHFYFSQGNAPGCHLLSAVVKMDLLCSNTLLPAL
jgi:hypothetical protein